MCNPEEIENDPYLQENLFKMVVLEFERDSVTKGREQVAKYGLPAFEVINRPDCVVTRVLLVSLLRNHHAEIKFKVHEKEKLPELTGIPLPPSEGKEEVVHQFTN